MTDVHDSVSEPVSGPARQPADYAATLPADDEPPPPLRSARRRKLPLVTLVLSLAAAVGVGFFAGVRVEKGQVSPTAAAAQSNNTPNAFRTGAQGRNAGADPSPGTGQQNGNGPRTAGTTNGGGSSIVGTIATIDGETLYVTQSSGDTVKVTTSDGTTVTKNVTGTVKDLSPGEAVVILAVPAGTGVYAAQSVTTGTPGGFAGGGRFGSGRGRAGAGASPSPSPAAGN